MNVAHHIPNLHIGMTLGVCKDCASPICIGEPWYGESEFGDDLFIVHCTNEDCVHYDGMLLLENEFYDLADFVEWDKEYIVETKTNVIHFDMARKYLGQTKGARKWYRRSDTTKNGRQQGNE